MLRHLFENQHNIKVVAPVHTVTPVTPRKTMEGRKEGGGDEVGSRKINQPAHRVMGWRGIFLFGSGESVMLLV